MGKKYRKSYKRTRTQSEGSGDDSSTDYTPLSPEDVEIGQRYAITIAPSDLHQRFGLKYERDEKFHAEWTKYMHALCPAKVKIKAKLEIKNGRLHYHGWIKWKTEDALRDWELYTIHTLSQAAQICVKRFEDTLQGDEEGWMGYATKQTLFKQWLKVPCRLRVEDDDIVKQMTNDVLDHITD